MSDGRERAKRRKVIEQALTSQQDPFAPTQFRYRSPATHNQWTATDAMDALDQHNARFPKSRAISLNDLHVKTAGPSSEWVHASTQPWEKGGYAGADPRNLESMFQMKAAEERAAPQAGGLPWRNQQEFEQAAGRGKIVPAGEDTDNLEAVLAGKKPATDMEIGLGHPLADEYEEGSLHDRIQQAGAHAIDDNMGRLIVGRTPQEAQALHQRLKAMEAGAAPQWDLGLAYGYHPDDVAHFLHKMGWDHASLSELARKGTGRAAGGQEAE